jgi:hypothetical protein
MKPLLKNFLWDFWALALAVLSIVDWRGGELSGYWSWAICWLALGYTAQSTLNALYKLDAARKRLVENLHSTLLYSKSPLIDKVARSFVIVHRAAFC